MILPEMLTILVTGEPLARTLSERGDFVRLIRDASGSDSGDWRAVDARAETALPALDSVTALVITGSPASVTERADWMLRSEAYLRVAVRAGTPTFGICFGHQLLASALGGKVDKNPSGREIGTVEMEVLEPDPILRDLPSPPLANQTHVDSVLTLPEGARVIARTRLDPHAAVRFGERAWGVQFHPEIDGQVMRHYIDARLEVIESEGIDARGLARTATDGTAGTLTLRRFLETLPQPVR